MHVLSVFLVLIGLIALVLSLIPLTTICRYKTGHQAGWYAMFVLVLVFILGYLFFCYHLMFKLPEMVDIILSGIFAGGGLFVVLVSRMSLASLYELKNIALEHENQALHDSLTGLPNRKSLMLALNNTIAAGGRGDAHFAIMIMDLNGFKEVNDTLGHQAGDYVLQTVAPRLNRQLRSSDTLCRMGGDEFAVILPQTGKKDAKKVAKKILAACAESITLEENDAAREIVLGISIGIALSPQHARDKDTLIRYADVAMYQAKQQKTGVALYSKKTDTSSINQLSEVSLILQALNEQQLMIYYQPIFSKQSLQGLEISLCWFKEDGSIMNAQNILKNLVNQGASWPLIEYVVDETFSNVQRWQQVYDSEFNLHLNLFLTDINPEELCDYLVKKAKQYQLLVSAITIEVSEALLELHSVTSMMNSLKRYGFNIAVEEFGSNGAGLVLLNNLQFDEVKLDQTLINTPSFEKHHKILVKTLKSYCDNMNITFIVPHVRDASMIEALKAMGIHNIQGSALCPYIATSKMDDFLRRHFRKH